MSVTIPENVAGNSSNQLGITAAGMVSTFIIQKADLPNPPELTMAALTAAATVRIDCWLDMGDVSFSRTPNEREVQRACSKIASKIKVGETIEGEITAIYDQQAESTETINRVYGALPEGAEVYIYRAYGFDSSLDPKVGMKGDLYEGNVQMVSKNEPANPDEDLKFTSQIAATNYWPDVAVAA